MAGHLWNITSYFKTKAGEGTLFFHVHLLFLRIREAVVSEECNKKLNKV